MTVTRLMLIGLAWVVAGTGFWFLLVRSGAQFHALGRMFIRRSGEDRRAAPRQGTMDRRKMAAG